MIFLLMYVNRLLVSQNALLQQFLWGTFVIQMAHLVLAEIHIPTVQMMAEQSLLAAV